MTGPAKFAELVRSRRKYSEPCSAVLTARLAQRVASTLLLVRLSLRATLCNSSLLVETIGGQLSHFEHLKYIWVKVDLGLDNFACKWEISILGGIREVLPL